MRFTACQIAWRTLTFNDANWAAGPAELGYGDGDEKTVTRTGKAPHPMAAYFRQTFVASNVSQLTNLMFRMLRDDGAVVYLNGVEVQRVGMGTDAVTYATPMPVISSSGVSGKATHVLDACGIPVVQANRGGQVTYHGPGQIVAYLLLDMRRLKLGVRELVRRMEGAVIDLLQDYHISAEGRTDAPGVYVNGAKIAALGLKIKNGCCYHGLALNVHMDLTPFAAINPCGYAGLQVTQTHDLGIADGLETLSNRLAEKLQARIIEGKNSPHHDH